MRKLSGVRSGAWLTENEVNYRSPRGISTYGLVPVVYENADKDWEKAKREIAQDFRELRKRAVTASSKAKKAIKKSYDLTGIWGASALGSAGGLAYVCSQHPGDEYSWLKGMLGGALIGSSAKLWKRIENKKQEYKRRKEEREKLRVQKEIRDLLKELVKTPVNGDIHRKIGYKGRLEDLLKSMDIAQYTEPELIDKIRKKEVDPLKEDIKSLYRVQ